MIEKFICLIFGHDWSGMIRGGTMMRRCLRCGKFEIKSLETR